MTKPIVTIRPGKVFAPMPDGERIVVSGTGPKSTSRMVSLATGQDLFTFEKTPPFVRGNAVSSDGTRVAFAADCDRVIFYDPETGQKGQSLKVSCDPDVSGLEFIPGSTSLLRAVHRELTAIEPNTNGSYSIRPLRVLENPPDTPMYDAIAFSSTGNQFACAWTNPGSSSVSLLQWPSGKEINRISWEDRQYQHHGFDKVVFTPGDQSLLLSKPDRSVTSWDLTSSAPAPSKSVWIEPPAIPESRIFVGRLAFSPDGTLLAYGMNGILGLWAWPNGRCLGKWKVPGRDPMFYQVGFSKSGRELIASYWSAPMGVHVYRLADLLN
jgi:WD40 repeat protein